MTLSVSARVTFVMEENKLADIVDWGDQNI